MLDIVNVRIVNLAWHFTRLVADPQEALKGRAARRLSERRQPKSENRWFSDSADSDVNNILVAHLYVCPMLEKLPPARPYCFDAYSFRFQRYCCRWTPAFPASVKERKGGEESQRPPQVGFNQRHADETANQQNR